MISTLMKLRDKNSQMTLSKRLERNTDVIHQYILSVYEIVEEMGAKQNFLNFLEACNNETYTIEHPLFSIVLSDLNALFESNDDIYLTFISIKANEDSLDHNGRSRQHECKMGLRDRYLMSERSWYIETDKVLGKPTMSLPYRDTSGSYITSFTKALFNNEKEVIGVVGFDINLSNILKNIQTPYRYLIVASRGEILFDSKEASFNLYQSKFNLMMLVKSDVFCSIMKNESKQAYTRFDDKKGMIFYKPIIPNKYYFIQTNEKIK